MRYVGNGEFISGVPARDLTAEEWEGLTEAQRQTALGCGLYELLPGKKQTPAQKGSEKRKKDGE
jgi:hypothetical protein